MLIHSFATDGYYDFAVSLIESFKNKHGEEIPFLLHSKELSDEQLNNLYRRYKNLTIKNSKVDWAWLTRMSKMDKKELLSGKRRVEKVGNREIPGAYMRWKHYISIYCRYRDAIAEAFDFAGEGNHILHLDADLYINQDITKILNLIQLADVSLLLRPDYSPEWRRVYGCILGFTVNKKSREFMARVRTYIHAKGFVNTPKGYGQTVFWRAYNDLKKTGTKFTQIPKGWIDRGYNQKAMILSANNGRPKGETAKRYSEMRKGR